MTVNYFRKKTSSWMLDRFLYTPLLLITFFKALQSNEKNYGPHVLTILGLETMRLKLTSHGILHYLWSADLSKGFSQLIMSIFMFSKYFLNRICLTEKCGVTPHCLYRDWLTLNTRKKSVLEEHLKPSRTSLMELFAK